MSGAAPVEQPLSGGHVSSVVRVGDTVRRAAGAWTPTVHRLLAHVRSRGLTWVPEPLGLDELGREVLSFIPGEVPHAMPEWVWAEHALTDSARALRQWHEATSSFDARDSVWNLSPPEPHEVICHNDFAPYNCVFREGRLAGVIDFDLCAPGPRLWDIAYTAYRFVPLMPPADAEPSVTSGESSPFPRPEMMERLDVFLEAYGPVDGRSAYDRAAVIASAAERLQAIADWTAEHVRLHGVVALQGHPARYRAHARWLQSLLVGVRAR